MRDDMRDVLITRGRKGGGWRKPGRQRPLEELPLREPIMRGGTKHFDDHLGPLKRFLASRVGRPWDEVWSELTRSLDRRGLLQEHVFVHLRQMVVTDVIVKDGVLGRMGYRGWFPLHCGRWRTSYFVDPATSRLQRAPDRRAGRGSTSKQA